MLTRQNICEKSTICVPTSGRDVDQLLASEWLLTNDRGSYAASTIIGCNTSSYHALLVGALNPPANRIMALSNCLEMVISGRQVYNLSTVEFREQLSPAGYRHQKEFRRDIGAHFEYTLEPADIHKAVYLARSEDTVVVEYDFRRVPTPIDFVVRPFVGLRDFHTHQKSFASLACEVIDSALVIRHEVRGSCELSVGCSDMWFETDPQWWFNFVYRLNRQRGQDESEDLWTPGFFKGHVERPGRVVFWAHLSDGRCGWPVATPDVEAIRDALVEHQRRLVEAAGAPEKLPVILVQAADQFVVKRQHVSEESFTILAGFPWFADWGRDTFIALGGLLLATGRHAEARSVLRTFAAVIDEGMIPNRFDDRSGTAYFNSVDASLWFIHAAFQYLDATKDEQTVRDELLPAMRQIIDAYHNGTRFGIHADVDGLIVAGDENTQLSWMDAKCDGIAFTPRWGKAVEVNALWHNALRLMSEFCQNRALEGADRYGAMAERVGQSFAGVFWNPDTRYLNDTVMPGARVDASLRPNQIFAVSLPFGPPLTGEQRRDVVAAVERELLTPYGLRTLDRGHSGYKGRYGGPLRQRDEAYHQGTAWPYLIGAFVEAYLKVNDYSAESKQSAAQMLDPLLGHVVADGCLGSAAEIFDGDPPQQPKGCLAQAWSVGELVRALQLVRA